MGFWYAIPVAVKMLIGFAIFFSGVTFNVFIMRNCENPRAFKPILSFVVICAGLLFLVFVGATL